MTKHEFLNQFATALRKNHIRDAEEILSEYEQHFELKQKDGYSEEEIAARLGEPEVLARQFEPGGEASGGGRRLVTAIGLVFLDLPAGLLFALLCLWELVMAAFSLACGALAVGILGRIAGPLIPDMPLQSALLLGLALLVLAVLFACACVYFFGFLRQLLRAYGRFHSNTLAEADGRGALPPLSISPQLGAKEKRRLRLVFLLSLIAFAAFFILGFIVSAVSAGAIEFWHRWNWFV